MIVWTLVMILWLPNGSHLDQTRDAGTEDRCRVLEDAAQDAAKNSADVVDIGTLCVKTEFRENAAKPKA